MPELDTSFAGGSTPSDQDLGVRAPQISLPKGGGAIRGIGEKFAANLATGTGSITVPIAVSPGRSGVGPQLSLTYATGAGNGPFGFGWSLGLPAITRKTDKGLPQYRDAQDSDVFLLAGAEDLVPVFEKDAAGNWLSDDGELRIWDKPRTVDGIAYTVRRYRPRSEGSFARIERWTRADGDVHWRSISRDNVLTLYGRDAGSRIADPLRPDHVFSWLICETRDDRGNAIVYEYRAEDGTNIDLAQAHEHNRGALDDPRRTANRYLKRILYGNRLPMLGAASTRPVFLSAEQRGNAGWMFEVVFDYGDHDHAVPRTRDNEERTPTGEPTFAWRCRPDPFSSCRSGFEVRTLRLCRRVLMFHHFPTEEAVGADCLVRSTDFEYSFDRVPGDVSQHIYSFLLSVRQTGYTRSAVAYLSRSLPPVEFEYARPELQSNVQDVSGAGIENLPAGLDAKAYRWVDLHGEGAPGILVEQAGAWLYKRNLSPLPVTDAAGTEQVRARFAPLEAVASKPSLALASDAQFMDLSNNGLLDLVLLDGLVPGLFEHDGAEGWLPFRPFSARLNRDFRDPNLRLVDLDGDGCADVLITEDVAFVWHASLAEAGFGPARRVAQEFDEEKGPRLVFAEDTQTVFLADMNGDGLADLVRIRNAEVCYWPNLGFGRFGAKVTMGFSALPQLPLCFDQEDQFDPRRLRLADIDGSGTIDIIYLHRSGPRVYFNQSGNSWAAPQELQTFPRVDDVASIQVADLLGNGTACLVWSSPLQSDMHSPFRYVSLMGGGKPHLLTKIANNIGAETRVRYAPSTKFYLQDKREGRRWITRLPFPVQTVEQVETYDLVSGCRFVSRFAYHHGYFDHEEREFRGFGMVEQWDTEGIGEGAANFDQASLVPPVCTRTWFHTGAYRDRDRISNYFAGLPAGSGPGEYFREPDLTAEKAAALLLDDTVLPLGLTPREEREACRALKGAMLRQEVYAQDASADAPASVKLRAATPYAITEQNFAIELLQPADRNPHAVFCSHTRESIHYHYERDVAAPRVEHAFTLQVDPFGNVLEEAAIAYGRRSPDPSLPADADRIRQARHFLSCTSNRVTRAIDDKDLPDDYRTPLACEVRAFELTGIDLPVDARRFAFENIRDGAASATQLDYEATTTPGQKQKRLLAHSRTLFRKDDLTALLPLTGLEPFALAGETYQLCSTPALLDALYDARVTDALLEGEGAYVHSEGDMNWWAPSGRVFLSPKASDSPAQELAFARSHFFLPHRYRNAFGSEASVTYDSDPDPQKNHNLFVTSTLDPLGNRVFGASDYRVLQPAQMTDANGNRAQVRFDALGMVVGTALMGKADGPIEGDSFETFATDLSPEQIASYFEAVDPRQLALTHLGKATTRFIYDLTRVPACSGSIARETHVSDLSPGAQTQVRVAFAYSDGLGREIQRKLQAEPGTVPLRDAAGAILIGHDGEVRMSDDAVDVRWIGSAWVVYNNKGLPVRQFEPFFSDTCQLDRDARVGVSSRLFYDPLGRVVARLQPSHTWEKIVVGPWSQTTYDVSDTVLGSDGGSDPKNDADVADFFRRLPEDAYLPTWYALRTDAAYTASFVAQCPDAADRANEILAAAKSAAHANTPMTTYLDALGRAFVTTTRNKVVCTGHALDGTDELLSTRVETSVEGLVLNVRDAVSQAFKPDGTETDDALGRVIARYAYDMLGTRGLQLSMEAGTRWVLNDVNGNLIRAWDSRGHEFSATYDALRRPVGRFVRGTTAESDVRTVGAGFLLVDKIEYGEGLANASALNLRTRVHRHLDTAGVIVNSAINPNGGATEAYDFKGNLLRSTRQLCSDYRALPDWQLSPALEGEKFVSATRFDALNRPVQSVAPHNSLAGSMLSVIQPVYNVANALARVDVWLDRASEPSGIIDAAAIVPSPVGLASVQHDAKGQRVRIDYKNGVSTAYRYDPRTFRLARLITRRNAIDFAQDCPSPPPAGWPGCQVQSLRYTYDAAGTITHIQDDAQQALFFKNTRVEPSSDYTYDSLARLIEATGREHLGQSGAPTFHSYNDAGRVGLRSADNAGRYAPNDGTAMGRYVESYTYDAVGNFVEVSHSRSDAAASGWTRGYEYKEISLIEDGAAGALRKRSNRLSATSIGGNPPEPYTYDAHGNILQMPQLQKMRWGYQDQLVMTQRQKVNDDDADGVQRQGERTFYVYDSAGQRVRKVTDLANNGGTKEERLYLGGYEVYRKHAGNDAGLVRETLYLTDDKQRIARVEMRNEIDDGTSQQLISYQLVNHIGSTSLELNEEARIISYEEYTPYGATSYQAVRNQTEVRKRDRFTGRERDEETGFSCHGTRSYAPWLGRWTSCDSAGLADGPNLYRYCSANPLSLVDINGTDGTPILTPSGKPTSLVWLGSENQGRSSGIPSASLSGPSSISSSKIPAAAPAKPAQPAHKPAPKPAPPPKPKMSDEESMANLKVMAEALGPHLKYPKPVRQAAGVGQVVGGSLEAGAGLLASELGVGVFLYAHGVDVASSGVVTAITGEDSPTYTFQAGKGVATAAGADPKLANAVGQFTDLTANIASAGLSLRMPGSPNFSLPGGGGGAGGEISLVTQTLEQGSYLKAGGAHPEAAIGKGNQVLAGVEDTITGERFFGRSAPDVSENLHPALKQEFEPWSGLIQGDSDYARLGPPGAHGEINALNRALWARDPMGTLLTAADLSSFDLTAVWLGKGGPYVMPRCPTCWFMTPNVTYLGPIGPRRPIF